MSASTTQLTIANRALHLLGHPRISVLAANNSKAQTVILDIYDQVRLTMLESFPWKNASKQVTLVNESTITAASQAGSDATITLDNADEDIEADDTIVVAGVTPDEYNGTHTVGSATTTTVVYPLTPDPGAGTAFGTVKLSAPDHEYANRIHLPDDMVRLIKLFEPVSNTEEDDYRLAERFLLTNADTVKMEYVYDSVAYTKWDNLMIESLSISLARDLALPLLRSQEKYAAMNAMYDEITNKAFHKNSVEPPYRTINRRSDWLESRKAGTVFTDPAHRKFGI